MSSKKNLESSEKRSSLGLLIDTSVLIEYSKSKRLELLDGSYISIITLIEFLRYFKDDAKRKRMKDLLEGFFRLVGLDNDVVETYCKLYRSLKEEGSALGDADLLIASTAIAKNLALYTLDRHFERLKRFGLILYEVM